MWKSDGIFYWNDTEIEGRKVCVCKTSTAIRENNQNMIEKYYIVFVFDTNATAAFTNPLQFIENNCIPVEHTIVDKKSASIMIETDIKQEVFYPKGS